MDYLQHLIAVVFHDYQITRVSKLHRLQPWLHNGHSYGILKMRKPFITRVSTRAYIMNFPTGKIEIQKSR